MASKDQKARTTTALGAALACVPEAQGIVLLVVRPKPLDGDENNMDVEVASAFRGRVLTHAELRDLLQHMSSGPYLADGDTH